MFKRLNYLYSLHSAGNISPEKTSINYPIQHSIDYNKSIFDVNMSQQSTSIVSHSLQQESKDIIGLYKNLFENDLQFKKT